MSKEGWKTLWEKEKMLITSISSFSTMFSKYFFPRVVKNQDCVVKSLEALGDPEVSVGRIHVLWSRARVSLDLLGFSWECPLARHFKALTHYRTTNFRLFRIERLCRRQFQIWRKWQKVIQTGRKHCGNSRNCSLRAISPFPTVFSKGLFPRGVKRCHCVGMG